jgi:putative ABC transport system permease protein
MTPIALGPFDLAVAALLVVVEAVLSLVLGLGIHRQVTIAAARMVAQLLLVGYALRFVFALASPALTLLTVALMALIAAREVAVRPEQRLRQAGNYVISILAVVAVTTITAVLALTTAIRPDPWWQPRYAIPLAGIVLGSVLNRRGTLPIINQMSAAGLITLPGIMTGQILAGMDPVAAVKYQILLMFLLAGSSVLAAGAVALLALRRLTDARERLRLDWLKPS